MDNQTPPPPPPHGGTGHRHLTTSIFLPEAEKPHQSTQLDELRRLAGSNRFTNASFDVLHYEHFGLTQSQKGSYRGSTYGHFCFFIEH